MFELHKNALVMTADGQVLGTAIRIYRNPQENEINPELKLFAEYLYVFNYDLPDGFFVPVDYIATYDPEINVARLKLTMPQVDRELLTRKPQFIAFGQALKEPLPA